MKFTRNLNQPETVTATQYLVEWRGNGGGLS